MKLIIDIQDFVYNNVKEFDTTHNYELNIVESIKNGTPLEEELEEIKKDIIEFNPDYEEDFKPFRIWSTDATSIIDKHISELKGE